MNAIDLFRKGNAALRARWYLRHAVQLGPRTRLWGRPSIQTYGTLVVGDRVRLVSTVATLELVTGADATLTIGDNTFINYGCSIAATKRIQIGADCNIGTYVMIMDNDFHRLEPERRHERPESAPIVLEDNVWIGGRAIILKGVTIGEGSVVGAGSVVTKDVPPRTLVAGMPARTLRTL